MKDSLAELVMRKTRNLLGLSRMGSNPIAVIFLIFFFLTIEKAKSLNRISGGNKILKYLI